MKVRNGRRRSRLGCRRPPTKKLSIPRPSRRSLIRSVRGKRGERCATRRCSAPHCQPTSEFAHECSLHAPHDCRVPCRNRPPSSGQRACVRRWHATRLSRCSLRLQKFFSFEFFPPKTDEGLENLWERMDLMVAQQVSCCIGDGTGHHAFRIGEWQTDSREMPLHGSGAPTVWAASSRRCLDC